MVVKKAEWWLGPTTPDQCGQNSECISVGYNSEEKKSTLLGIGTAKVKPNSLEA